ncbi:IQ domain-containing protein M [Alligator sinensis]|uniref:IQ domain-containing protein M n=1 Tax=Alligator sinensis TaxID=38654 RepID=A0A3Q0G3Q2_ALLSI|nr:IQ domain-containing protein M [Alligator sinensis]
MENLISKKMREEKRNGSVLAWQLPVSFSSRDEAEVSTSAPPILAETDISYSSNPCRTANLKKNLPEVSLLKKSLYQFLGRPKSLSCLTSKHFKRNPQKIVKCPKILIQPSPQPCMKLEERISISELLVRIDSISKTMEHQNSGKYSSISRAFSIPSVSTKLYNIPWILTPSKGKMCQDWRGVISQKPLDVQEKLKMPQIHQMITTDFQANKLKRASSTAKKPERRASSAKRIVFETQEKVKRIGPHLEIFEAFHGARRKTSFRKLVNAIVCIQRFVRGWLERTRYRRIKMKSESHGPSLSAVVKKYRKMLSRIKRRSGLLNLSTSLSFSELEEWMDKKTFYETMFAKREFWKEMDRSDLPGFLRDCGHFLSSHQIDEALRVVCPGSSRVKGIKRHQAVEVAFMLCPPSGAGLKSAVTVKSTWVQPVVDGKEGYKFLESGHPALKAADLRVAAELVASSMREWKWKNPSQDS